MSFLSFFVIFIFMGLLMDLWLKKRYRDDFIFLLS